MKACDLQEMVLSVPRLMEYVGRNLLAKPNLLGKMAHLTTVVHGLDRGLMLDVMCMLTASCSRLCNDLSSVVC